MAIVHLRHAVFRAREELHPLWTLLALVVLALAVWTVEGGVTSAEEAAVVLVYTTVVTASAFNRFRRWNGFWIVVGLLLVHFSYTFYAGGATIYALLFLLVAGSIVLIGVREVIGTREE